MRQSPSSLFREQANGDLLEAIDRADPKAVGAYVRTLLGSGDTNNDGVVIDIAQRLADGTATPKGEGSEGLSSKARARFALNALREVHAAALDCTPQSKNLAFHVLASAAHASIDGNQPIPLAWCIRQVKLDEYEGIKGAAFGDEKFAAHLGNSLVNGAIQRDNALILDWLLKRGAMTHLGDLISGGWSSACRPHRAHHLPRLLDPANKSAGRRLPFHAWVSENGALPKENIDNSVSAHPVLQLFLDHGFDPLEVHEKMGTAEQYAWNLNRPDLAMKIARAAAVFQVTQLTRETPPVPVRPSIRMRI